MIGNLPSRVSHLVVGRQAEAEQEPVSFIRSASLSRSPWRAEQASPESGASGHTWREQQNFTLNGVTRIVIVIRVIKGQLFLTVSKQEFKQNLIAKLTGRIVVQSGGRIFSQ